MGGLPKKAIKFLSLAFSEKDKVKEGSHQTYKATYIENGKTIHGFYKEISAEKQYPALLALMSVAASLFKRVFQGSRSAEERLVFNDKDELVGTFSFNVEGFKPFNFKGEKVPDTAAEKDRVIPCTKTLIKENFMEILAGRCFLHDDDCHPHNMSLTGDIDFDMFWYWFTVYMKGARPGVELPSTHYEFTTEDYVGFPATVKDYKPFHWATFYHPGQESIKISGIPGQATVLQNTLPKVFPDPSQFEGLSGDAEAQEQKFAAFLKILMTKQDTLLRKELTEIFGDITLNYTALGKPLSDKYEETFPFLCNVETNKQPFIDFIMKMYQYHYDSLYRVVVFFMGRDNNGYNVALPATSNSLYLKPSFYKKIEAWVIAQNKLAGTDSSLLKYDLVELRKRYHQIWRDAFAPNLKELLKSTYDLTHALIKQVTNITYETEEVGKKITDDTLISVADYIGTFKEISKEEIIPKIKVDLQSSMRDATELLIDFVNQFNRITMDYYQIKLKDLTEDDNLVFAQKLRDLHNKFNLKLRTKLLHTSSKATEFSRIADNLNVISEQINFQIHLLTTDEQMKLSAKSFLNKPIPPLNSSEATKEYTSCLFDWAKLLKPEVFNNYVIEIINKHYIGYTGIARHRAGPVKEFLGTPSHDTCDHRLAYIFSSGKDETGALNTLLVQHLTKHMLQNQQLPGIVQAVKDGSFEASENLALYTREVVKSATTDKRFKHLFSVEGSTLFFKTMFDWISNLKESSYEGLIKSSVVLYESKLLWSTSRRKEILGYNIYSNQAKRVAFMFQNGGDSSSFNTILFEKIIDAMKAEMTEKMKQDPKILNDLGNKLIMDFKKEEHLAYYLSIVKAHSQAPANIQEPRMSASLAH